MNMPHRLLLERGDGFQLDRNLLEQQQNLNDLARVDPWFRLQYLLRQLQQGRFGELALLSEMMARHRSGAFWHAGATLLGFAGPPNIITRVIDGLMTSSIPPGPTERVYFCAAFAASCGLWAIPRILEIYSTLSDLQLRSEVEVYLSNLLEEEPGPIWHGPVSRVEYDEAPLPFRGERTSIDF